MKQIFMIFIILLAGFTNVSSQEITTITLAVPSIMRNIIDDALFVGFYDQFPNTSVEIITIDFGDLTDARGFYDPLIAGEKYANSADVMIVDSEIRFAPMIDIQQTLAGYYLDLQPLVAADSTNAITDLHPAMQDVFRWSDGIWALPLFFSVNIIAYDPIALDEAGVSYPTGNWTLSELINAASILSEYNGEGSITQPGFVTSNADPASLIFSLLGEGIVDASLPIPEIQLDRQQLSSLITEWSSSNELTISLTGEIAHTDPAIILGDLSLVVNNESKYRPAPLPGGHSSVTATGIAVSKGTLYPELSYELAKYLTQQPEIAAIFSGTIPARMSYGDGQLINNPLRELDSERRNAINAILADALPAQDIQFSLLLSKAMFDTLFNPTVTVDAALNELEQNILTTIERAEEISRETNISVDTPSNQSNSAGQVINFGIIAQGVTNQFEWERLAEEYLASNTTITNILYETPSAGQQINIERLSQDYDCFYTEGLRIQAADTSYLYAITPLLASDNHLDVDNFLGNILESYKLNNENWGLPISADPMIMLIDERLLDTYGIAIPDHGWSIAEFESLLPILNDLTVERPVLRVYQYRDDFIMSLISAHSEPPIDYRYTPPTLSFDNPEIIRAAQDVLELIRRGYIEDVPSNLNIGEEPPIIAVGMYNFLSLSGAYNEYGLFPLPYGENTLLVTTHIGSGYISRQTAYVNECYNFIKLLMLNADRLDLFPAYITQNISNKVGYARLNTIWRENDVVFVPTPDNPSIETSEQLVRYWLGAEFNAYIESGTNYDLQTHLIELQNNVGIFRDCIESIDLAMEGAEIVEQYFSCIALVDPQMAEDLPGP